MEGPPFLMVGLSRSSGEIKLNHPVAIPRVLEFQNNGGKYEIHNFITHMGEGSKEGHYVTVTYEGGSPILHDDERVRKLNWEEEETLRGSSYVICYRKLENESMTNKRENEGGARKDGHKRNQGQENDRRKTEGSDRKLEVDISDEV